MKIIKNSTINLMPLIQCFAMSCYRYHHTIHSARMYVSNFSFIGTRILILTTESIIEIGQQLNVQHHQDNEKMVIHNHG